jgi:hypothetical protein
MVAMAGDRVGELLAELSGRWAATTGPRHGAGVRVADSLIEALDAVLHDHRDAVYVSTPITTGRQFVTWWQDRGHRLAEDDPEYQAEFGQVIADNIAAVRPLIERVERGLGGRPVIDPTRLGPITGWQQPDYHAFWVRVIQRFVRTVVFADGWEYSSGCSLEYAAAVAEGLQLLDAELRPLTRKAGDSRLAAAAAELEQVGLGAGPQLRVLDDLRVAGPPDQRP